MRDLKMNRSAAWTMAVGAAAGVAAAALWTVRGRVRRADGPAARQDPELENLEQAVVDALLADEQTSRCAIDVGAIGPDIIELSGQVATPGELTRVVTVTQGVDGVRTVVNRVEVGMEQSRARERQRRYEEGDPALTEQHWYGVGVGTGRRRQGGETDPARRDDRVDMVTRQFEQERDERPEDRDVTQADRHSFPPQPETAL